MAERILSAEALREQVDAHPEVWRPLVLTNGCFDLLHAGHVHYLAVARSHGRSLVVGLNSDQSVRRLKGESRPIVPERERAEILVALRSVDAVVVFGEPTATELALTLQPDIYIKGGDYANRALPEVEAVQAGGGKVVLVPFIWKTSTSAIVERIRSFQ